MDPDVDGLHDPMGAPDPLKFIDGPFHLWMALFTYGWPFSLLDLPFHFWNIKGPRPLVDGPHPNYGWPPPNLWMAHLEQIFRLLMQKMTNFTEHCSWCFRARSLISIEE